jgi:general L-amino acid transport system substrate-binding protein
MAAYLTPLMIVEVPKMKSLLLIASITFILFTPFSSATTLDEVRERGYLRCGVNVGLLGFSTVTKDGLWEGFDVEFCRALSAAVFQDSSKVKFIGLTGKERFVALKRKDIDVLYRNTTMNAVRGTSVDLNIVFAGTNYYDGQGFLVSKKSNISSAFQLENNVFCMTAGSNSVGNLKDFLITTGALRKNKILELPSAKIIIQNLESSNCDVVSSDQSQLYALKTQLSRPDDFVVLPEVITKEPLGPAVLRGDSQWFSIVRWTLQAMIEAEFENISSSNIDALIASEKIRPNQARLVGVKGNIGENLGLKNDWSYHVLKQVGNYSEVFERTIGSKSQLGIARGLNAQWNAGGILYSSPF